MSIFSLAHPARTPWPAVRRGAERVALATVLTVMVGCAPSIAEQQRDVASALVEHLQLIHEGKFEQACQLVDPQLRDYGQPCQQSLPQHWTPQERAELVGIAVDSSQVVLEQPTRARIPAEALTFSGQPSQDTDYTLTLIDKQWMLS